MLLCRMHTNNVDTHNFGKNLNYECAIKCALHRDFGIGKIMVLSGTGENQRVGVVFKDGTKKKLIVKYANLTKIN